MTNKELEELITFYATTEYTHVALQPQFDCEMVEFSKNDLYKLLDDYAQAILKEYL